MLEQTAGMAYPQLEPSEMKENAGSAARFLKSLANENRLMILCTLMSGERSVGELNAEIGLSQSSLSQHLGILRNEGLVETRRESQSIYYSLADSPAMEVITVLHRAFCDSDGQGT